MSEKGHNYPPGLLLILQEVFLKLPVLRGLYVLKFSINVIEFTTVKDTETLVQEKKKGSIKKNEKKLRSQ